VQPKLKSILKTLIFTLGVDVSIAVAAPEGGEVTSGDATISSKNSTSTTTQINQTTNKAIIQWQSFDVDKGESVKFITPGADAVTLNRIMSGNASDIEGHVTSNGQLWLINPNGILFGAGAQVNAAGLLASTMNITDQDFLNGNYHFTQEANNSAYIINQGNINATNGGYVAMLAPQINNTGIISAELGTVAMVAGNQATLTFQNNQLLNIAVPSNVPLYDGTGKPVALTNSGTIQADGGQVLLTAAGMNELLDESINVTGIIKADTVNEIKGKIILTASGNTILDNANISAQGGSVEVLGQNVGLFDNTSINVSGAAGGGDIHVGWDKDDPNAVEAQETIVDPNVILNAGSNGFVETSGDFLQAESSQVTAGMWLLDPLDITIESNSGSNTAVTGSGTSGSPFQPNASGSIFDVGILNTDLASSDIYISTSGTTGSASGDINVDGTINPASGTHSLTLTAAGSVNINDPVTLGGSLNATAQTGNINIGADITGDGLSLTSTLGYINQTTGTLTDTGTTTLSAGGGDINTPGINLGDSSNDFGTVNFTASASNASVTLQDVNGLTVAGTTKGGTVTVVSNADGSGTGTLTVGSAGIDTTDADSAADGASIYLTDNGTAGNGISLEGNLNGGTSANNELELISQFGDITQSAGAITTRANGNNGFRVSTGGSGAIDLNSSSNQILAGANLYFTTAGGDITLNNSAAAEGDNNTIDMNMQASNNDSSSLGAITLTGSGTGLAMALFDVGGTNGASLTINNQGDVDLISNQQGFDFTGDISITSGGDVNVSQILDSSAGNITLAGATVSLTNNVALSTIADKTLTISGAQATDIDNPGTINTAGSVQFNNVSGDDLALAWATTVAQNLGITLTGAGNLTQADALTVTGTTTLDVGAANNATLNNTSNDFSTVSITSGKDVSLTDSNALDLGASTVSGNLSVTSGAGGNVNGAFTQSGALAVTGTASFTNSSTSSTASNKNITLTNTSNDFSTVAANAGNNVSVTDNNALVLGASTVGGNLAVITGAGGNVTGALTQSGALTLSGPSSFTNSSTSSTAADKAITLTNTGNNFDHQAVTLSAGGAVQVADDNGTGLSLGTVSSGALTATAEAGLTASSGIIATGNVSLTANTSSPLNAGVLTVGGNINAGANSVSLRNNSTTSAGTNAISLTGGTLIAGALNLTVTSGNINQSGGHITASGITTLSNSGTTTLTVSTNDFATVTGTSLGATTLKDVNSLILGNLGASTLTVTTGSGFTGTGALTQSGVLTLTGPSSFTNSSTVSTAGAKDITLSNASNSFGHQAVTLSAGGTINIADSNSMGLTLGIVSSGALTATATHGLTVGNAITASGNVSLTANSGNASNTGVLSVGSNINAGANNISLNNSSTAITSSNNAISLTGGTLTEGALNLTVASGNITQGGGNIVSSGTTSVNAGSGDITLTRITNNFGHQVVTLTGNNVSLTDNNGTGLLLGAVTSSGTTALIAQLGTITDGASHTGSITAGTSTSLTSHGSIDLENTSNSMHNITAGSSTSTIKLVDSGLVGGGATPLTLTSLSTGSASGGISISVNDLGSALIVAGAVNADGGSRSVSLTADGSITDNSGAGSIEANATTLSANGAIDLENSLNEMSSITASTTGRSSAQNITLVDSGESHETASNLVLENINTSPNSGNISLTDLNTSSGGSTQLVVNGAVNAGTGTVTLAANHGAITDNAGVGSIVAGTTNLTAGTNSDDTNAYIDLENSANKFGTLSATAYGTDSIDGNTNAITLVDGNTSGLVLGNIIADGNLAVTTSGSISQSGTDTLNMTSGTEGANTATFNIAASDSGAVSLGNANDFNQNPVTIVGLGSGLTQGDVTSATIEDTDSTGLNLGTISTSGDFSATATNALSLTGALAAGSHAVNLTGSSIAETGSGAITTSGTTTLSSAGTINLNGSNDFGTVVGSGTLGATTLDDVNSLILGALSASGLTVVTATTNTNSGAITQSGALTVSGTASFTNSSTSSTAANKNITLTTTTNDFGTFAASAGNNVSVTDSNALILGASTVGGNLAVTSGAGGNVDGALTQSGALTLTGSSSFTNSSTSSTSGYQDITLTNTSNNFGNSAVSLAGNNISVVDNNGTGFVLGTIIGAGTVNITSNQGSITDNNATGYLQASATNLTAGSSSNNSGAYIDLESNSNQFGTVSANAYGTGTTEGDSSIQTGIYLLDNNNSGITIGSGGLTTHQGDIFHPYYGSIYVVENSIDANATTTVNGSISAGTANVSLTNNSGNISSNDNAISLTAGTLTANNLNLTVAGGNITQSGGNIVASGTTTLSNPDTTTLNSTSNDFGTVTGNGLGNVALKDANSLILGAFNGTGLTVVTGAGGNVDGALTQSDVLILSAPSSFTNSSTASTSGYQDITLTNSGNNFGNSAVSLAGKNLSVVDNNSMGFVLGTIIGTGTVNITSNHHAITDNNATGYIQAAATNLTAGSTGGDVGAYIDLESTSNQFGTVSANAYGEGTTESGNAVTGIYLLDNNSSGLTIGSGGLTTHSLTSGFGRIYAIENSASANTGLTVNGNITVGNPTVAVNLVNNSTSIDPGNNAISLTAGTLTAGALNLTTDSGNINQSGGHIAASGTTTISNAHTTTLNQITNDFATVASSGTLGSVTLEDANSLILGALRASGLTVTTAAGGGSVNGALTQSGALTVSGTASFYQ